MVKRISGIYSLYINDINQNVNIYGNVDSNVIGNADIPVVIGENLDGQLRNLYVNDQLIGKRYYYCYYYYYYHYYYSSM